MKSHLKPCTRCGKLTAYTCLACRNPLCPTCAEDDPLCAVCRDKIPPKRNQSDVARLLAQIDEEYQAATHALRDFSQGSSQHQFITQRMENMRTLQEMIAAKVGEEEAAKLVVEQLDKSGQEKPKGEA